jgi:hypothetical protein
VRTKARVHLERGGERPSMWPWGYFGEPLDQLRNARRAAGL